MPAPKPLAAVQNSDQPQASRTEEPVTTSTAKAGCVVAAIEPALSVRKTENTRVHPLVPEELSEQPTAVIGWFNRVVASFFFVLLAVGNQLSGRHRFTTVEDNQLRAGHNATLIQSLDGLPCSLPINSIPDQFRNLPILGGLLCRRLAIGENFLRSGNLGQIYLFFLTSQRRNCCRVEPVALKLCPATILNEADLD